MPMRKVEILRAACCVASLDGVVHERERKLLEILRNEAGVGEASFNAMLARAQRDPDFFEEQFRIFRGNAQEILRTLVEVAAADGDITTADRVVLHHFAEKLSMNDEDFQALLDKARPGGG